VREGTALAASGHQTAHIRHVLGRSLLGARGLSGCGAVLQDSRLPHDVGREHARDYINIRWHDVSRIPLTIQVLEGGHQLGVGVILIDCSEVGNQHLRDGHRLGPRAVDLDDGEVLLLAPKDVGRELVGVALSAHVLELAVLRAEQVGQVASEIELYWEELLDEVAAGAEPVDLLVVVEHDHAVGVAGGNLGGLLVVLLVDEKRSRRQLAVQVLVAELPLVARSPRVHLAEGGLGDRMLEPALDRVDSLTHVLEAMD